MRDDRATFFFDLGLSYWTGTAGKPLDRVEAHKWLNLAAGRGSADAACARVELAGTMSADEIIRALRGARLLRQEVGA
jgi:TPR repeat protein